MQNTTNPPSLPIEGRDRSLWLAILGAPFLWLCHLQLSYTLVPWIATHNLRWLLHIVTLFFLALVALAAKSSWREFRHAGSDAEAGGQTDPPLGRVRMLALLGLMTCALFGLAIFAQGLASFVLIPTTE